MPAPAVTSSASASRTAWAASWIAASVVSCSESMVCIAPTL